jgi:hypothetical protein
MLTSLKILSDFFLQNHGLAGSLPGENPEKKVSNDLTEVLQVFVAGF